MYGRVLKGEGPTALYIRTKCLSHFVTLCVCVSVYSCVFVCVCVYIWVQVNIKSITTNPRVEPCNSDCFTRMHPQIYGCVYLSAWVRVCLAGRRYA